MEGTLPAIAMPPTPLASPKGQKLPQCSVLWTGGFFFCVKLFFKYCVVFV